MYPLACGLQAVGFESLSKLLDCLLDSYFCMLLVHGHILVEHFHSPPGSMNEMYKQHKIVVISNIAYCVCTYVRTYCRIYCKSTSTPVS